MIKNNSLTTLIQGAVPAACIILWLSFVFAAGSPSHAKENDVPAKVVKFASLKLGASFVDHFEKNNKNRWGLSHGWTNGTHQNCHWNRRNFKHMQKKISLTLTRNLSRPTKKGVASKMPKINYNCGEMVSKKVYGYGTYEVRMKPSSAAAGIISSFFTYIGPSINNPGQRHDEIDFEFLGRDKSKVQLNTFSKGQANYHADIKLGFIASEQYANYAFEWLPKRIRWFINGRLVHEAKKKKGSDFPKDPGKIIISIWNTDTQIEWMGTFVYPGTPLFADYSRIAFTKAGDPCQFPDSIVCKN